MISIIICSRETTISQELSINIAETIGCPYELIVIENSKNKYSIFEAYNLGIQRSKGGYLCFIHDDILFHTEGWGNTITSIFQSDDKIGLIGVAGAKVKTKMPSGWWNCPDSLYEVNILQHLSNSEIEKWEYGQKNELVSEVVVIDGVFMVMKSSNGVFFDNDLRGFHNYDLNISIEHVIRGFKVVATKEILIEHFSRGVINKIWVDSTFEFHKKYKNKLPLITEGIDRNLIKELEFKNGGRFVFEFLKYGFGIKILRIWFLLILNRPIDKFHRDLISILLKRFIKYKTPIFWFKNSEKNIT